MKELISNFESTHNRPPNKQETKALYSKYLKDFSTWFVEFSHDLLGFTIFFKKIIFNLKVKMRVFN